MSDQTIPEEIQSAESATSVNRVQKKEYSIAPVSEFPPNTHRVVKVGRREIGVFNVDGVFYALPNLCTHQLGRFAPARCRGR